MDADASLQSSESSSDCRIVGTIQKSINLVSVGVVGLDTQYSLVTSCSFYVSRGSIVFIIITGVGVLCLVI